MRALKVFESFRKIYIEARANSSRVNTFLQQYSTETGENVSQDNAFLIRSKSGWVGSLETRIYFDAPDWTIESLRKLGYRVVKRQFDLKGAWIEDIKKCPWRISDNNLFWALVNYGYRIGENDPIFYDLYMLRQLLKIMDTREPEIVPGMKIRQIESENPTIEAMFFADIKKPMAA